MRGVTIQNSGYTVLNKQALIAASLIALVSGILAFEFQPEITMAEEIASSSVGVYQDGKPSAEFAEKYDDGRVARFECVVEKCNERNDVAQSVCRRPLFDCDAPFWKRGPVRRSASWMIGKLCFWK